MFGITYSTWKSVCEMYLNLKPGTQKAYLQWFPFTRFTPEDKCRIISQDFFDEYIKTGSFILFPYAMYQSENYLQKSDGSFRDSSLISPILYLVLQSIGKEIFDQYTPQRPGNISVYYAGNYAYMRPKYKQDYDDFFKDINASIDEYQYFIKSDITNFFANISIDTLIRQIDTICNMQSPHFSQVQLSLYKELLTYCGNGRFPLIENSIASSFLATVVYLDSIDTRLHKYISENISIIADFRIVRYVDDMYILVSTDKPIGYLHKAYNEIRNEYSSILKEYGLALNTKKCCLKETREINAELKKSLYDEFFNGQKHDIEELFQGALLRFLNDLSIELLLDSIDIEGYNALIQKHFSSNDIEFTAGEVFNYFVYENDLELQSAPVVNAIIELLEQSISFISLDSKRLTVMIMKTKNAKAIKAFLNQLFRKNREGKWNSYDTTIAIAYLIQSEFRHIDLLSVLSTRVPALHEYYYSNCATSAMYCLASSQRNSLRKAIANDSKAHYLYFMHLCEMRRTNYLAAFAYFKNCFDRITADLDFSNSIDPKLKKPNYKRFYSESTIVDFYKSVNNSEPIIRTAHKLRNANPLAHSSSELLDHANTSEELCTIIDNLMSLLLDYIRLNN